MKKGDLIFVYGTLRHGERADLSRQQHQFGVTYIGEDAINGDLYHLGSFPGVKAKGGEFEDGKPCVFGEVFRVLETSIIAILDAYEGYDADNPQHGLYNRIQTETAQGRIVWVYIYNPRVLEEQRIESGDWVKNRETSAHCRKLSR